MAKKKPSKRGSSVSRAKKASIVRSSKKQTKPKIAEKKSIATRSAFPLTPLMDRVLVRPLNEVEMGTTSPSGILIPDSAKEEKTDRGVVVAVGAGKRNEHGTLMPVGVGEGDSILFQWGEKVEFGGKTYFLVREDNILAVLNS